MYKISDIVEEKQIDQSQAIQCVRGQTDVVMIISDMILHILHSFDMVFTYFTCGQTEALFIYNASNKI